MTPEAKRLSYIETNSGSAEALRFAEATMRQYRKCVLQSYKRGYGKHGSRIHHASLPQYRRDFIESYLVCKAYIRNNTGDSK